MGSGGIEKGSLLPDANSRTGTVTAVVPPAGRGTYKIDLQTDDGKSKKLAAWGTVRSDGGDDINNQALQATVGDYGTFKGYEKDEEYQGKKFTRFYATSFTPGTPPSPGSFVSPPGAFQQKALLSPLERAVEAASRNIDSLISVGAFKDWQHIPAAIHELVDHYASKLLPQPEANPEHSNGDGS